MVIPLFVIESTQSNEAQKLIRLFYLKVSKLINNTGVHGVDGGGTGPTSWKSLWGTSPFIGIKPLKWYQTLLCYCCSLIVHFFFFFPRSVSHIILCQLKKQSIDVGFRGKRFPCYHAGVLFLICVYCALSMIYLLMLTSQHFALK